MQMIDTVHEGDGDRLIAIVKYLLLMFKAKSNYSKYAIVTMRFITQVKCKLTEQMAVRVIYGRFSNPNGKPSHNMETDIAIEHTMKGTKVLINGMGANKTQKAGQRVRISVGEVHYIFFRFPYIFTISFMQSSRKYVQTNVWKMKNLNINFNLAISLNFNYKRKCLALYTTCFTMISNFVQISDIRAASYLTSDAQTNTIFHVVCYILARKRRTLQGNGPFKSKVIGSYR